MILAPCRGDKIKNPMSERGHGSCRGRESPFLNALKQDRLQYLLLWGYIESGLVGEDHKARLGTRRFFDKFGFGIVHRHFGGTLGLREVNRQIAGQQNSILIWLLPITAENNMGAGDILGMEPDIVGIGYFEG